MAHIIDGHALAAKFYEQLQQELRQLNKTPRLDVILVGDNPASQVYVQNKQKACARLGIESQIHRCPATTPEISLTNLITQLNQHRSVHGILVQLPLPLHLDPFKILCHVDPRKDVDGLHPCNLGALLHERPNLIPCTPLGVLQLIQSVQSDLKGARVVVIGRSVLVGKPATALLTREHATVTLAHSQTKDLPDLCRQADIVVAAIGKPRHIQGSWLKQGAIVVDVGINKTAEGKICGDVDFDNAQHVEAITPVPGGVGPMTIVNLLGNTLRAMQLQS